MGAECAHVVVPEATPEALSYYQSGNILFALTQLLNLLIPALFLFTGFSGKLGKFAEKIGKKWFFSIPIYLIFFVPLYTVLQLPLDFYKGYIREHAYGLSVQSVSQWFSNYGMGILVTLVIALLFVWIFYLLLHTAKKRWWLYSSFLSIGVMFFMFFIQPIWIDPLFNHFGPMKNKELEKEILSLAEKAGISQGRVFEVDKSKETKALNAYVVGLGSSNRIVLWDTTIEKMSPQQLLFVMGHEMGHYVLKHGMLTLLYFGILSFIIFYFTYKTSNVLLEHCRKKFQFTHIYDIASLPLLLFSIQFFLLLFTPLSNYISRSMEREADCFGLEITRDNKAAGEAFVILQNTNLSNPCPGPLYTIWQATHPSLADRIHFCNTYCPWEE